MKITKKLFAVSCLGLMCLCLLLTFFACASSPASGGASPEEAQAAAQDALNRMDGGGRASQGSASPQGSSLPQQNAPSPQQNTSAQQGTTVNTSKRKPAWVDSVDSVYSRAQYVAAVGYAVDRAMAEKNAFANLTAIFGQSIYADQTITNAYQEVVKNGTSSGWTDNIDMQNVIKTSNLMDTLIGAEIKEVWFDSSKNTCYALAVMERAKAISIYTDMCNENQAIINNMLNMDNKEKFSIEGYSRYYFAAIIADVNNTYVNVIKAAGGTAPANLKKADDIRLEASNIIKEIPVRVVMVSGQEFDNEGRIKNSFSSALSNFGFRITTNSAPYALEISLNVMDEPSTSNVFIRYFISANFKDTKSNQGILPVYSIQDKAGHRTKQQAINTGFSQAVAKINDEYGAILQSSLSSVLSKAGRK